MGEEPRRPGTDAVSGNGEDQETPRRKAGRPKGSKTKIRGELVTLADVRKYLSDVAIALEGRKPRPELARAQATVAAALKDVIIISTLEGELKRLQVRIGNLQLDVTQGGPLHPPAATLPEGTTIDVTSEDANPPEDEGVYGLVLGCLWRCEGRAITTYHLPLITCSDSVYPIYRHVLVMVEMTLLPVGQALIYCPEIHSAWATDIPWRRSWFSERSDEPVDFGVNSVGVHVFPIEDCCHLFFSIRC